MKTKIPLRKSRYKTENKKDFFTSVKSPKKRQYKNNLLRDLYAMTQVWELLKSGTIRWFGEVGRQY